MLTNYHYYCISSIPSCPLISNSIYASILLAPPHFPLFLLFSTLTPQFGGISIDIIWNINIIFKYFKKMYIVFELTLAWGKVQKLTCSYPSQPFWAPTLILGICKPKKLEIAIFYKDQCYKISKESVLNSLFCCKYF